MSQYDYINADILDFAEGYDGEPFHALLCDAPYHLTSITKRFGKENSAPTKEGEDGAFGRLSKGFMGQEWDGGDVAFRPETWAAMGKLLYPGAFGLVFGGARTFHRMAVAIEDAGFIIHPTIFVWLEGASFPKATNIHKQLKRRRQGGRKESISNDAMLNLSLRERADIYKHEKNFHGHRYGLQVLKPVVEPIIMFQKPYESSRAIDDILLTGAGAVNIEGTRVGINPAIDDPRLGGKGTWQTDNAGKLYGNRYAGDEIRSSSSGRWPTNFLLVHNPGCRVVGRMQGEQYQINRFTDGAKPFGNGAGHEFETETQQTSLPVWECIAGCPVQRLDNQSGSLTSDLMTHEHNIGNEGKKSNKVYGEYGVPETTPIYADTGGASRFYPQVGWSFEVEEGLFGAEPVRYESKPSPSEKVAGVHHLDEEGNIYNPHPTVKPIALTRWLATLLLPPEAFKPRRILIPFAGVGSEMIGAFQARWDTITGIELMKDYVEIGEPRLQYWIKRGVQLNLF